jgi:hypothetical protein
MRGGRVSRGFTPGYNILPLSGRNENDQVMKIWVMTRFQSTAKFNRLLRGGRKRQMKSLGNDFAAVTGESAVVLKEPHPNEKCSQCPNQRVSFRKTI